MAFSLIADVSDTGGGSGGTTAAIDTTGADLLVLCTSFYGGGGGNAPTVSDSKSNSWTTLTEYPGSGSSTSYIMHYCLPSSVGTGHTFTVSGSGSYSSIHAGAWSGAHATSSFDVENGAYSGSVSSIQTGSVTPSEDDELLVYAAAVGASYTMSGVDIGTLLDSWSGQTSSHYGNGIGYQIQTTATARNPDFTATGTHNCAAAIAAFKAAAVGGGLGIPIAAYHYNHNTGGYL